MHAGKSIGQAFASASARPAISGSAIVDAITLRKSATVKGCFSVDTKCSRSQRDESARHAAQVIRKLMPMPKPVSSAVKMRRPCHRSAANCRAEKRTEPVRATYGAVVDVVVKRRKRRAVVAKSEDGGDQRIGHARRKIDARKSAPDLSLRARPPEGGEKRWGGPAFSPHADRTLPRAQLAGRRKRRAERWQKPTPSPVHTGFQASVGGRGAQKLRFPCDIDPGTA